MSEGSEEKVALVFTAHPEEAETNCAGTVAKWVREGWKVFYVICADLGSNVPYKATDVGLEARQRLAEVQHAEQGEVGKILGLQDILFLNYRGGTLQSTLELRREMVRLLRTYKPYRVICQAPERSWTPSLYIGHYDPDHRAVGEAVISAIYPAAQNPWDFPELLAEGLLPHKVKELYVTNAPTANYWVDISELMDLKIEALLVHTSQYVGEAAKVEQRTRRMQARIGKQYGVAYAEEFHRALNL